MGVSDLLGYGSIICWLFAQLPQIIKNARQKSCAGLALPFLANWFMGDFSNLVGCILTHQLPFQTVLASYFVFVDAVLVVQFFYYDDGKPAPTFMQSRGRALSDATIRGRHPSRYRTLSAVSANIAAVAALAAHQDEVANPDPRWNRPPEASSSRVLSPARDVEDGNEDALPSAMTDSFHSEGGGRHKHVAWGSSLSRGHVLGRSGSRTSIPPSLPHFTESPTAHFDSLRGRSAQRDSELSPLIDPSETIANRRSSRAGRRGAGMVLLSVWAMFSVGTLTSFKQSKSVSLTGQVLSPIVHGTSLPNPPTIDSSIGRSIHTDIYFTRSTNDHPIDTPHTSPSNRDILGRIFAWLCTTLYLTSRLPQIWKNFVRKSVEGLSVYLFIFAFLGNCFYVASILSSPNLSKPAPESSEFLRQSIPYLLGSAGTLMFDITIVSQTLIYRPRSQRRSSTRHHGVESSEDEEARLLQSEPLLRGRSRAAD